MNYCGCRCVANRRRNGIRISRVFTFVLLVITTFQTAYIALLKLDSFNIEFGTVLGIRRAITYGLFNCDTLQGNVQYRDKIASHLSSIYSFLESTDAWNNRTKLNVLERLIRVGVLLNSLTFPGLRKPRTDLGVRPISCPEVYKGTLYDYPEHFKNWEEVNCTHSVPVLHLVTFALVVNTDNKSNLRAKSQILLDNIRQRHPEVMMAISSSDRMLIKTLQGKPFTYGQIHAEKDSIHAWNLLMKTIKTPFVFVARHLSKLGSYSDLRRPLTLLNNFSGLGAVLFAHRASSGYWQVDCYQSSLKNYELVLKRGYKHSFNESLVCHYGRGSFVASTEMMRKMTLDTSLLQENIAFLDFFLRLKAENYLVASTIDYMVLTSNAKWEFAPNKEDWFPFVKKWQLNRLKSEAGVADFDCMESGIICRSRGYTNYGFMVPLCCLKAKSKMLNDVLNLCAKLGIPCELDSGSIMSAVKFQRQINWDLDEDVCMLSNSSSLFRQHIPFLQKQGPYIVTEDKGGFTVVYEAKHLRKLKIDIFKMSGHITIGNVHTGKYDPTKINYHGVVANIPYNPGLYVRNRYGPDYLKHAPSWVSVGLENSFSLVSPGKFISCALPGHHACLDQFEADGNMDFGTL